MTSKIKCLWRGRAVSILKETTEGVGKRGGFAELFDTFEKVKYTLLGIYLPERNKNMFTQTYTTVYSTFVQEIPQVGKNPEVPQQVKEQTMVYPPHRVQLGT